MSGQNILSIMKKYCPIHQGDPPTGWLTIHDFGERCDIHAVSITKDVRQGKIPRKHIAINKKKGKQERIIINWDAVIYDYLFARRPRWRPDDFVINDRKEYKPFKKNGDVTNCIVNSNTDVVGSLNSGKEEEEEFNKAERLDDYRARQKDHIIQLNIANDEMTFEPVIDQTSARFRKEQLEIQKKQLELRSAANDLMKNEDVKSWAAGIAAELNGNASKAIPKWSPILAAEEDPKKIRQLLKRLFVDMLTPVNVAAGGSSGGSSGSGGK